MEQIDFQAQFAIPVGCTQVGNTNSFLTTSQMILKVFFKYLFQPEDCMRILKVLAATFAWVATVTSLSWGQCETWTTSTIRNCNGIDYELWNQNNTGTASMTITGGSEDPNGGTFEASWSGTENILARAGKKWGSSSTTTAASIGNITLDFEATWTSSDNVKMLGVYGWAYYPSGDEPTQTESGQNTSFSNQIEYYIIQDRGSYNPASGGVNAVKYGEATIDGILYEFWVADRINQPMLTGNGNFKQYFSVPKNTSSHRQSGKITISKHFDEWDKAGMQMMDCALYEIAMKVESYTGSPNGQGSANVTKNLLTLGGSGSDEYSLVTTVTPSGAGTVTRSPDNNYYAPETSVELTASPNSGYKFVGWAGDATGSASTTSVTMSTDLNVTAQFELESGDGSTNLIQDGDFPTSSVISTGDGSSWKLGEGENWGNSEASSTVSNGTASINIATIGEQTYQPQLVQYGVSMEQNVLYKLTFSASASVARKIEASFQQSVDPWATYASKEFDLTTTEQDFEFIFEMTDATDNAAQFAFNLGQATGTVDISNVQLVHTTDTPTTIHGPRNLESPKHSPSMNLQGRLLKIQSNDHSHLQIRVVDGAGKVHANFQLAETAQTASFSLADIPAGLYFVDITGKGTQQTRSLVLQ